MQTSSLNIPQESASTLIPLQQAIDPLVVISLLSIFSYVYHVPFNTPYILLAVLTFLLIPSTLKLVGVYQVHRSSISESCRILWGWTTALLILFTLGYLTQTSAYFSEKLLLAWAVTVPIALYVIHHRLHRWMQQASGQQVRTAVIVGTMLPGLDLAQQMQRSPDLGIKLLGFFEQPQAQGISRIADHMLLGDLKHLPDYVRRHAVDVVYIALSDKHEEAVADLLEELRDTTACVYFVPNVLSYRIMRSPTQEINGIPVIAAWTTPFSGMQSVLKRLIDIAFASLAVACLSPVMLAIAIAVRLSSPGPILFKQRRYGLNGQEIIIYKFRSMTVMEDGEQVTQAKRDDQRITKVGAFLRRTSLDELPQFLNVLQGRMSIVGPRPHAVSHNEQYRKLISGYMLRHKVKPGITGWAQVHGLRGETDTLDKMRARVEYDLQYLRNWSLGLDLHIIFRTALVFLRDRNAY